MEGQRDRGTQGLRDSLLLWNRGKLRSHNGRLDHQQEIWGEFSFLEMHKDMVTVRTL